MNLATVRAQDLMRSEVASLSPEDTIELALTLFEEVGISGAPVIAGDRLVGMLTLADVSRPEHRRAGHIEVETEYELSEPVGEEFLDELDPAEVFYVKEDYSPGVLGREVVGDWMSSGVISVPPSATLQQVCEVMVENQIHRVCVTEHDRLVGLISSFDVVRHFAQRPRRATPAPRRAHARARRRTT